MGKEDESLNYTFDTCMKSDFRADLESNLEANFNAAMNLTSKTHDYQELLKMLSSEKIVEKQIAALEIPEIKSKNDAIILASNLTGQDGKVREAVAFKLNELSQNPEYLEHFLENDIFDILLDGVMDINGNVCRMVITSKFFENIDFCNFMCEHLPERIMKIINDIKDLDLTAKQYVVSKRNFQLYWALEAFYNIIDVVDFGKIEDILGFCADFYDYTIREKTAKIVSKLDNPQVQEMKEKLINDENFYVRRGVNGGKC